MPFKYDVRDSDPSKAIQGGGEQAPVGMYQAKVVKATDRSKANPDKEDLEVIYEITATSEGKAIKESYAVVYDYVNFNVAWKMDQFLQAMGVTDGKSKRSGEADETKFKNKKVKLRVKGDTYNGEYRAKCGGVWKLSGGASAGSEDEPDDADDADDDTTDDTGSEEETWAEVGARIDEQGEDELEDDVNAMTEAAEEQGINPDDYDTWQDLGETMDAGDAAEPDDADGDDGSDEGDDAADGDDVPYNEWSLQELRDECEARDLDTSGAKSKLVARLEENDAEGPFD